VSGAFSGIWYNLRIVPFFSSVGVPKYTRSPSARAASAKKHPLHATQKICRLMCRLSAGGNVLRVGGWARSSWRRAPESLLDI
jgi:hypothetical protein